MRDRIGIVGGGQLGRMLSFAAKRMGFTVTIIDPTPHSPAGQVVDREIVADYNDEKAIKELASVSDFITFDIELANAKLLDELSEKGIQVNPSAKTLTIIKDKLSQNNFLKKVGIPVADFVDIPSSVIPAKAGIHKTAGSVPMKMGIGVGDDKMKNEILAAIKQFGYPILLKARFDAYDGRGNALIKTERDIDLGLNKLKNRKLYVEKFVPFTKELAVVIARNTLGEIATYPVVETIHKNNICHIVYAPAPIDKHIAEQAKDLANQTLQHLEGAGVFGIEMFLSKDGKILVNEIAPRVHNSGHFTIEACVTSQFEQHIRAITGLPLGSSDLLVPFAVMVNILGDRSRKAEINGLEKALSIPNVAVHIYGKTETRPERKMGHVTATANTLEVAFEKATKARRYISI